jgi:hypothetical protein
MAMPNPAARLTRTNQLAHPAREFALSVSRKERDMKHLAISALLLSSVSAFADDKPSTYTPPKYRTYIGTAPAAPTTPYNPTLGGTSSGGASGSGGSGGYTGETFCNGRASVNGKC